jgi:uncharacterized protein involved in type VI secretion and phage assembly
MHFPLLKGTEVLVAFMGGDPDRPVILGAVPDSENYSVVTDKNHFYSQMVTPSGNRLMFSDKASAAGYEMHIPGVLSCGAYGGEGTS